MKISIYIMVSFMCALNIGLGVMWLGHPKAALYFATAMFIALLAIAMSRDVFKPN